MCSRFFLTGGDIVQVGTNYILRLYDAMIRKSYPQYEIDKCCTYASNLLSRNLPVLFDAYHVETVLELKHIRINRYHVFHLNQVGKIRQITAPSIALKQRQQWILREILNKVPISTHAHGFHTGRSIRTNALIHANNAYVLCLDIQNFFPSIPSSAVFQVYRSLGYSNSAAAKLTDLCCYNGRLPQGAPTSPSLSNIILKPIDEALAIIAKQANAQYSRYADDLTFSANEDISHLLSEIKRLLLEYGFQINTKKIHWFKPGQPKRITGLTVQNGSVRVPKQFKRALRQEIYYCKKYGVFTHLDNVHSEHRIHYREHLYGKAYFVHMIEPEIGAAFLNALDEIQWP